MSDLSSIVGRLIDANEAYDKALDEYVLALDESEHLDDEKLTVLLEATYRLLAIYEPIANLFLKPLCKKMAIGFKNAEKVRLALHKMPAIDEDSASSEGEIRQVTGLTEREYKRAMRFLKKQNAVRTKPRIGTWLVG